MFSKYPPDSESDKADGSPPASEVSNVVPLCQSPGDDGDQYDNGSSMDTTDADQNTTVMQMAFLEMMTRKVMEATAACEEASKHLKGSPRKR